MRPTFRPLLGIVTATATGRGQPRASLALGGLETCPRHPTRRTPPLNSSARAACPAREPAVDMVEISTGRQRVLSANAGARPPPGWRPRGGGGAGRRGGRTRRGNSPSPVQAADPGRRRLEPQGAFLVGAKDLAA